MEMIVRINLTTGLRMEARMPSKVKCKQCGKIIFDDDCIYVGKKPHCSVECAMKTAAENNKNGGAK
jgi:hypothetical protein